MCYTLSTGLGEIDIGIETIALHVPTAQGTFGT